MCAGAFTGAVGRIGRIDVGADVMAGVSEEDDEVNAGGGCTVAEVEGMREEREVTERAHFCVRAV
jgi:hypothetical protein